MKINVLLFVIFLIHNSFGFGQSSNEKIAHRYFNLFQEYEYTEPDLAKKYADSGLIAAKNTKNEELIGRAYQFLGWIMQDQSRFKEANSYLKESLIHFKKSGNKQGIADAYGNYGNSFLDLEEYQLSLDYQQKSLKVNEQILSSNRNKDELFIAKIGRTYALHNIGEIYDRIGMFQKALEYEYKSIPFELENKNYEGVAISYSTLAVTHKKMNRLDSAEFYFKKSIELFESEKVDYPVGYATALQGYALMEKSSLSPVKIKEMLLKSLSINREFGDVDGEINTLLEIGKNQFDRISKDSLNALLNRIRFGIKDNELSKYNEPYLKLLSRSQANSGNFKEAYFNLIEYLRLKNISDRKSRTNELISSEIKHQIETKSYNDSLKIEHGFSLERASHNEEVAKFQNIVYLSIIGFIILSVSLFIFINSSRRRKKMNEVLSEKNELIIEQKAIVEERNQAISDSINYAKRLQAAILPTREQINVHLPNSFLFFKPKDVVSGDFYWFEENDTHVFIAVADCTGHGVPGAMVSVVCSNALNRCVNELKLSRTNEILDKARELVVETFARSGGNIKDGMDISLISIHKETSKVQFSGAQNPLWLVRRNDSDIPEGFDAQLKQDEATLYEFKGDKQPIGDYHLSKEFSSIEINLQKEDIIYLLSDGFADQFGGEFGKKYKYLPLKRKIIANSGKSMSDQKELLSLEFNSWLGDEEQIDDVCIMGLKF